MYTIDTTAGPYLQVIDSHEQCLNNATQQGRDRLGGGALGHLYHVYVLLIMRCHKISSTPRAPSAGQRCAKI